ncbi:hypothetical protein HPX47_004638 [Vibrio alginolyticus]|nr:hypothetical protein [Vibrio alginolyticus]
MSGNQVTMSNWQVMDGLQPTTEWAPGTFLGAPSSAVTLTNALGGDTVSVDIDIVGLQYNLGDVAGRFSETGISLGKGCETSEYDGGVFTIMGSNCVGNVMRSSAMLTPFHFVRPIIELDKTAIIDAFHDAKASSGQYIGTTMVRPFYVFKTPTGSLTYRHGVAIPITFSFRYEASSLESLQVQGDGMMYPTYDNVKHTVSGATKYRVTAKGFFSNGLKMTFSSADGDAYQLNYTEDTSVKSTHTPIPYSVFCRQCTVPTVVKDGVMQMPDSEATANVGTISDVIEVNFDVLFHDIEAKDVETGAYRGSFTVLFEENLE